MHGLLVRAKVFKGRESQAGMRVWGDVPTAAELDEPSSVTGTGREAFERNRDSVRLPTANAANDEYRKQAQITELSALNAAMAVIRFKQHFGLFDYLNDATCSIFDTAMMEIDSLGRS